MYKSSPQGTRANRAGKQGAEQQFAWQFLQAGSSLLAQEVSSRSSGGKREPSLAMVSTQQKATSSVVARKEVPTRTELPGKDAAVQVSGCRECHQLAL